jgi:regulator of protease activity HflC (stomatin/prohibitin superfamily)
MPTRYYVAISIVLFIYTMVFLFKGFIVIPNNKVGVLEKLGAFKKILMPGIHFIFPFRDRVKMLSLKDVIKVNQIIQIDETKAYDVDIQIHYDVKDVKVFAYSKAPDQIISRIKLSLVEYTHELDMKDTLNEALLGPHERWGIDINGIEIISIKKP